MDNIGLFLHFMKEIVDKNNFILVEREASLEFMAGMGITMDELKSVILSLTPRDCFDGPEADRDSRYPGMGSCRILTQGIRQDAVPKDVHKTRGRAMQMPLCKVVPG